MRAQTLVAAALGMAVLCSGCSGFRPTVERHGTSNAEAWRAFQAGREAKEPARKIRHYSAAVRRDPDYVWAYNNRGIAYLEQEQYDRAIADFTHALQLDPHYIMAYANRSVAYGKKGMQKQATQDRDKATELRKKYCDRYNQEGRSHLKAGNLQEAVRVLRKAVEKSPPDAAPYFNLALAYQGQGKHREALTPLTQAILLEPDWVAKAHMHRGASYMMLHLWDKALEDLDNAIELDPDPAEPYALRAAIYLVKKRYDEAWADVEACEQRGGEVSSGVMQALRRASERPQ